MGKSNGTAGSDSGTNRAGGIDGVDNGNGHIRTYLRVRPSKDPSGFIKIDEFDRTKLTFHVLPVEHREGEVGFGGKQSRGSLEPMTTCIFPATTALEIKFYGSIATNCPPLAVDVVESTGEVSELKCRSR